MAQQTPVGQGPPHYQECIITLISAHHTR